MDRSLLDGLIRHGGDALLRMTLRKHPDYRTDEDVDFIYSELLHIKALAHLSTTIKKQLARVVHLESHNVGGTVCTSIKFPPIKKVTPVLWPNMASVDSTRPSFLPYCLIVLLVFPLCFLSKLSLNLKCIRVWSLPLSSSSSVSLNVTCTFSFLLSRRGVWTNRLISFDSV